MNAIYPNVSVFWLWDKSGKILMRSPLPFSDLAVLFPLWYRWP